VENLMKKGRTRQEAEEIVKTGAAHENFSVWDFRESQITNLYLGARRARARQRRGGTLE